MSQARPNRRDAIKMAGAMAVLPVLSTLDVPVIKEGGLACSKAGRCEIVTSEPAPRRSQTSPAAFSFTVEVAVHCDGVRCGGGALDFGFSIASDRRRGAAIVVTHEYTKVSNASDCLGEGGCEWYKRMKTLEKPGTTKPLDRFVTAPNGTSPETKTPIAAKDIERWHRTLKAM